MREPRRDALAMRVVVQIAVGERQRLRSRADDAPGRRVADDAAAGGPMHLRVRLAARRFPIVDAAGCEVIADEREMLVARRIARHAPLLSILRQMAVTEQNSIQPRILLADA